MIVINDNFVPDAVLETSIGLKFYKNRELDGDKTTYRVIEVEGTGVDPDHSFIKELFDQYEGSVLKASRDYNDFKESIQLGGTRVVLIPDIKGDKIFDDRWERVVRFVEKHTRTLVSV